MNDLVMYFEKEKFLRQMLEGIFKLKGSKIHTEESISDKFYLIEDLSPSIVIADLNSVSSEDLKKLTEYDQISLIITTEANVQVPLEFQKFIKKIIVKPLSASMIYDQITQASVNS